MAETSIKVRVLIAWWLWPYIWFAMIRFWLTDAEPSEASLNRVLDRAIRVETV